MYEAMSTPEAMAGVLSTIAKDCDYFDCEFSGDEFSDLKHSIQWLVDLSEAGDYEPCADCVCELSALLKTLDYITLYWRP